MKSWIGRLFLAIWFVGMLVVAVRGTSAQGQSPSDSRRFLPLMTRNAPLQINPPLASYVGVFAASDGEDMEVYAVRADGSNLRQLTDNPFLDYSPDWSADGDEIAFVEDRSTYNNSDSRLMVMAADGSQARVVMSVRGIPKVLYEWSPTEHRLLVQSGIVVPATANALYLVTTNDGTPPLFLSAMRPHRPFYWGWSPNGRYVHYTQYIDSTGATELWTLNVATETRHRISANFVPTDSVEKDAPLWHPTSQELLYRESTPSGVIWRGSSPDGAEVRDLVDDTYKVEGWVLHGSRLLVTNSNYGLELLTPESGVLTPLTEPGAMVNTVKIAPNGQSLLYNGYIPSSDSSGIHFHALTPNALPVWLSSDCFGECARFFSAAWAFDHASVLYSVTVATQTLEPPYPTYTFSIVRVLRLAPDLTVSALETVIPIRQRRDSWGVQYLPYSSQRAMIDKQWAGYPPPFTSKPLLSDTSIPSIGDFPFAPDGLFEFGEWSYQP